MSYLYHTVYKVYDIIISMPCNHCYCSIIIPVSVWSLLRCFCLFSTYNLISKGTKGNEPIPVTSMAKAKICCWVLYSTDSRWGFTLGVLQMLAFLDTNMLVSPMQ